jgi:lysophospholipase L1-like esterase
MTTNLLDTFHLKSIGAGKDSIRANKTQRNLYYGFMLMNSHPGILYHAIGVNGARYVDYTSRSYIRQLALLKPSLLIVSLGTNEACGRNFSKMQFSLQVDALIRLIREELPETALLITTPAESYRRTYKNKKRYYVRNDNISQVSEAITAYTKEQGVACWDLFSITGGYNSCKKWFDAGMLGRDRIHFSREGYGEQGVLLYKALVRSCIDRHTGHEMLAADTGKVSAEDLIISDMELSVGSQDGFAAGAAEASEASEAAEEFISGDAVPEEMDSEEMPEEERTEKEFIEIESGKKEPVKKEEAQDVE